MEQLEMLEQELKLLQENIKRLKQFKNDKKNREYKPYQSNVVGEFKHRVVALKQRLTLVSKITTSTLFN